MIVKLFFRYGAPSPKRDKSTISINIFKIPVINDPVFKLIRPQQKFW